MCSATTPTCSVWQVKWSPGRCCPFGSNHRPTKQVRATPFPTRRGPVYPPLYSICRSPPMARPDYWLTKFWKLRIDGARGDPRNPKPLLLVITNQIRVMIGVPTVL